MNRELLEQIVNAVLYEGYILYPYRPSVKNHQRWTFGGLYPESYGLVRQGAESSVMQTQVLVEGSNETSLLASVRFLHLTTRIVGELPEAMDEMPLGASAALSFVYRAVDSLRVGGKIFQSWQEASEREIRLESHGVSSLAQNAVSHPFEVPASEEIEPLRREDGKIVGVLIRRQKALAGVVELSAEKKAGNLFKVSVRVINRTPMPDPVGMSREESQLYSLASTHTILSVEQGALASSIDPPANCLPFAGELRNVGAWPVLVGAEPERDTMLASPIILYDYPQIAPQSPRNLFDSTEIDEILSLRIMTLTDEEKQAVAGADDRGRRSSSGPTRWPPSSSRRCTERSVGFGTSPAARVHYERLGSNGGKARSSKVSFPRASS